MRLKGKEAKSSQKTVPVWQFEDFDGFSSVQIMPKSIVISIDRPHPVKASELISVSLDGATWMGITTLVDESKSRDALWVHATRLTA